MATSNPAPLTSSVTENQATYMRRAIRMPARCESHFDKIENIRKLIASLEEQQAQSAAATKDMEFYNKGILIAGIVQDTSVAFLELAGAILSAADGIVPNAKFGENVSKLGLAAIDTTQSIAEVAYGQGQAGQIAHRTAGSALGVASPGSAQGKAVQHVGKLYHETAGYALDGTTKTGNAKSVAMRRRTINMMLDQAKFSADMIKENGYKKAGYVSAALSIVKAANNYDDKLGDRIDQYLDEKVRIEQRRAAQEQYTRQMVRRLTEKLNEALAEMNKCLDAEPPTQSLL
jgi:hypothetical protein